MTEITKPNDDHLDRSGCGVRVATVPFEERKWAW